MKSHKIALAMSAVLTFNTLAFAANNPNTAVGSINTELDRLQAEVGISDADVTQATGLQLKQLKDTLIKVNALSAELKKALKDNAQSTKREQQLRTIQAAVALLGFAAGTFHIKNQKADTVAHLVFSATMAAVAQFIDKVLITKTVKVSDFREKLAEAQTRVLTDVQTSIANNLGQFESGDVEKIAEGFDKINDEVESKTEALQRQADAAGVTSFVAGVVYLGMTYLPLPEKVKAMIARDKINDQVYQLATKVTNNARVKSGQAMGFSTIPEAMAVIVALLGPQQKQQLSKVLSQLTLVQVKIAMEIKKLEGQVKDNKDLIEAGKDLVKP